MSGAPQDENLSPPEQQDASPQESAPEEIGLDDNQAPAVQDADLQEQESTDQHSPQDSVTEDTAQEPGKSQAAPDAKSTDLEDLSQAESEKTDQESDGSLENNEDHEQDNVPAAQDSTSDAAIEKKSETPPAPASKDKPEQEGGGQEMTFTAHLQELRTRLTRALLGIFVGFLACFGFSEQLFRKLMEPLINLLQPKDGTLIYTGLPEAFFTHLKVAAVAGLFLASPYVFYQLWMFIAPGLYESERKWIVPIALCSALLFVSGALFGYYIVFPFGFDFFLGYGSDFITPMPSVREYFSFSVTMLFAFGLIFELPLFIFFLARLGIVTHKSLRKFQKYSVLANFMVAAILTPPDVVSQTLMALPLCVLYEIGIWIAYLFGRKPKKEAEDEGDAEGAQA